MTWGARLPVPTISSRLASGTARCLAASAEAAGTAGNQPLRLLNLAPAPAEAAGLVAAGVDWLVVNESEAAAMLGRPVAGLADAAEAAAALVRAGARNAVVTAGAAGAAYCGPRDGTRDSPGGGTPDAPDGVATVPGFPVRAVDTVGAGDAFVGALAVALAAGVAPLDAVVAAAAAGAAAATRPGTQSGMPRPSDVFAATGHAWPIPAP